MEESAQVTSSASSAVETLRTLRLHLATRDQELHIAKTKVDRLTTENEQLSSANADLQQRFIETERRIVDSTTAHFRNAKSLEESLCTVQDELWTEKEKSSILTKQFERERQRTENLHQELSKRKLIGDKLVLQMADEHTLRETVLGGFHDEVQQLTRYCSQLENEAVDSEQARQTMENLYADKMDSLQSVNDKLSSDLRHRTAKVEELTKELDLHKRHLQHLSENPTEQFKLISELYTAFVAAESKMAAFEQRELEISEYRNRAEKDVKESTDEMQQLRNALRESDEALQKAQKELIAVKQSTQSRSGSSLEVSDDIAGAREVALYREQAADSEKARFFSMLAKNSELFNKCVALASNESVVFAFLSEHDNGQYLKERKDLKAQLKAALGDTAYLRAQVQRLQSDLSVMESVRTESTNTTDSSSSSTDLNARTEQLKQAEESLKIARFEVQKWSGLCEYNKQMLLNKTKQFDDLSEREKKRLDEMAKDKKDVNDLRVENRNLTEQIAHLQAEHFQCSERTTTDAETEEGKLKDRIVLLRAEVEILKFQAEQLRTQAHSTSEFSVVATELSNIRQQYRILSDENRSLLETRLILSEKIATQEKTIEELERKYENEVQSERVAYENVGELRTDIELLRSSLFDAEKKQSALRASLDAAATAHQQKVEILQTELQYLTEERSNSDSWREIVWEGLKSSAGRPNVSDVIDMDIIVKHLRMENDLVKKQLQLAKNEYQAVIAHVETPLNQPTADVRMEEDVEAVLWKRQYQEKRDQLNIAIENSGHMRKELFRSRKSVEDFRRKLDDANRKIASLSQTVDKEKQERNKQIDENKVLQQQLEASNKRFDVDRLRQEVARLKEERVVAEQKHRQEMERTLAERSSQFQKRLDDMRTKHNELVKSKDAEIHTANELLRTVQADMGKQIKELESQLSQIKVNLELEKQELAKKLEQTQRQLTGVQRAKTAAADRYAQDLGRFEAQLAKSAKERADAQERIQRLETNSAAARSVVLVRPGPNQATSDSIQFHILNAGVPQGSSVLIRKPVSQTPPLPSTAKTAVVNPNTHPVTTVHRVAPQLRLPDAPVLTITPQAMEISPQPGSSMASTSHGIPFGLHHGTASSTHTPEGSLPSTSMGESGSSQVSAPKRVRESDLGSPEQKRRRDTSPTSSDVTSSTNAARNSLGQVGSASLLRARANSRSSGLSPPSMHMEPSGEKKNERIVGSTEDQMPLAVPAQDLQESSVEESSFVSESDAVRVRAALEAEKTDGPETESFTDYDTDDSQDAQPSSDIRARTPVSFRLEQMDLPDGGPDVIISLPADLASSSRGFGSPVDSSIRYMDEPATSSHAARGNVSEGNVRRPTVVLHTSGPSSSLLPPRTPGMFSSAYDVGDEGSYGVVPSTPKIVVPRREDESNMLPQVPSIFFGNASEAIEDVTASQVPPTPYQPDIEFFGANSENASEDSESSFPADDDIPGPVPSSSRGRSAAFNARMEEVEIADDAQPADIDAGFGVEFPESPDPLSVDPAVPSPGSIDSVEAVDSMEPSGSSLEMLSAVPSRLAMPARRVGMRRRGQAVSSGVSGTTRGASSSVAFGSSGTNPSSSTGMAGGLRPRQPIIAPSASPTGRITLRATRARAVRPRGRARRSRTGHQ